MNYFMKENFRISNKILHTKVLLQVWDTAGQERFRTITQSYYRSAHAVVCAFDLTQRKTFENVDRWMEDVTKYCNANVITLLVGTFFL